MGYELIVSYLHSKKSSGSIGKCQYGRVINLLGSLLSYNWLLTWNKSRNKKLKMQSIAMIFLIFQIKMFQSI